MINQIISGIQGCDAYFDDIIIYSAMWEQHLKTFQQLFERIRSTKLTVNLVTSEFGHAKVTFLVDVVGQGQVKPINAKICDISEFSRPEITKKQLMCFLGMAGYYRKFCPTFSHVAVPLTNLLQKKVKFV